MNSESSTKKVVINSIIYSFSGILLKCCNFFLLPLYTAYLTTEDYGITSIANSFASTMTFIVALSLYSAIMRFYVDLKDDSEKLKRFYGTITLFALLSGTFWFVIFSIFRGFLTNRIFVGVDFYPIVVICLIELVFMSETTVFDNIMKSQQKAFMSSILSVVTFFSRVALNLIFVVALKMGALGTILASAIVSVVYSISFAVYLLITGQMVLCIDLKLLKEALQYSIPIIPHNLATKIAVLLSKVLIGDVASLSSLGIYSVAVQFGDVADTLQCYVDTAYQPWLYEKLNARDEGFRASIRSTVRLLISVLGLLFIGIALFAQDYILLFVNKAYSDAWRYIPLIVLVYAIKTIYYFYVEILFYYKEASKKLFTATVTGSIINVFLSYFLIPVYGAYGSILADSIAMLIRILIIVFLSRKYEDVGLKIRDFVLNFVVILLFISAGLGPSFIYGLETFSLKNCIYKIFIVMLYMLIVGARYRKQLMPVIAKIADRYGKRNRQS